MILGFANLFFGAATEKLTTVVQAALASGYTELIDMMLTVTLSNGFGVIEGVIFWVTGTMTMAFASIKSDSGRQVLKGTITGFLLAEPFFKLLSTIMYVQIAGCDKVGNATLQFPKGEPTGTTFILQFGVARARLCPSTLAPGLYTWLIYTQLHGFRLQERRPVSDGVVLEQDSLVGNDDRFWQVGRHVQHLFCNVLGLNDRRRHVFVCVCVYLCVCVYHCLSLAAYVCVRAGLYVLTLTRTSVRRHDRQVFRLPLLHGEQSLAS